jgi:transcriptional regulator with XRE-family HTH domain
MKSTLNSELLASMIKSKRGKMGLREAARELGNVSPATLSRVEQGKLPDVETFINLCKWLNVPTDTFIIGEKKKLSEVSEKEQIVYQLRASKDLDDDTVDTLISMVNLAYTKVRKGAKK